MNNIKSKECNECFNSGFCSYCEQYQKEYYRKNKKRIAKVHKQYRQTHKEQTKEYGKQYRQTHKERIRERHRQYCEKNREKIKKQAQQYYQVRKEHVSQYYQVNKEKIRKYKKQYREKNREKINERRRRYYQSHKEQVSQYYKKRFKKDPILRLRFYVSLAIYRALKKQNATKKRSSVMKYIPYTIQQLKEHLEKQFEPWMNWNNHGVYRGSGKQCWHIDHIIPQSVLPYGSMDHPNFRKVWALENLRPLEAVENIKKSNKL